MNKFKVGDLVRGTKNSPYNITDEAMTLGEVVEVYEESEDYEEDICVKILEHRRSREIGHMFSAESQYFEPVVTTPKIILSPDNSEDIDWLTYKSSQIIVRLSEKSGIPIERLIPLIVIGAEKFVEIEDGTGEEKGKDE